MSAVPDELLAAAQHLLQVAAKHKTLIAGFAFSENEARPFIMPFSTATEKDSVDPALYAGFCRLAKKQLGGGGPEEHIHVGEVV